jgi:hypothetical protein
MDNTQRAIDITTDFVNERLNDNVAVKLVIASILTQPDEIPSTFQSEFMDFGAYGSDVSYFV